MGIKREALKTVSFIDNYCSFYENIFPDVRSFEHFKYFHLGLISDIPRKSLPGIAKAVGLKDGQELHHMISNSSWETEFLEKARLSLLLKELKGRSFSLIFDETGDRKKGKKTDYVSRQYLGSIGKIDNGIVSVNAYGVIENITFPLIFRIFKPKSRLKEKDEYKSKPNIASEMIDYLVDFGFKFDVVLADSLYGESINFKRTIEKYNFKYVLSIQSNHGVLMPKGKRVRKTRPKKMIRSLSNGDEIRYIQEVIFGSRRKVRYFEILDSDKQILSYVQTNITEERYPDLTNIYGLRSWIELGFRQVKNELGWCDYKLTDYKNIQRWWEIIFSTYLMISLQTSIFHQNKKESYFEKHKFWSTDKGWKKRLNNLKLIIQPYIFLPS